MSDLLINPDTLKAVLSKMLNTTIIGASHQIKQLQGGTVGNVNLIAGIAQTASSAKIPFNLVQKIQEEWERWGDPFSWRREYDLYASGLGATFSSSFYWPACYHAEINKTGNETQLWMEYIQGVSGKSLTIEMLETAATELGRYQGKLHLQKPDFLQNITNLGEVNAMEVYYRYWKPRAVEYNYIRDPNCKIPRHLCDMLIDIDNNADAIFESIRKLPVVFCHRDFWIENILYSHGKIALIDWDTTGWGYLGEDIAQLITDGTDPIHWQAYRHKLIPAYLSGFAEYMDIKEAADVAICKMTLVKTGYLCVDSFLEEESAEGKDNAIKSLQMLYDVFYKQEAII